MKRCIKSSLTEKTAALSASWGLRTSRPRAGIASLLIYDWKLSLREEKKTVTLIPISLNTNIDIYIWEILRPILIGIPTSWIVWSIKPSIRLNSLLINMSNKCSSILRHREKPSSYQCHYYRTSVLFLFYCYIGFRIKESWRS